MRICDVVEKSKIKILEVYNECPAMRGIFAFRRVIAKQRNGIPEIRPNLPCRRKYSDTRLFS